MFMGSGGPSRNDGNFPINYLTSACAGAGPEAVRKAGPPKVCPRVSRGRTVLIYILAQSRSDTVHSLNTKPAADILVGGTRRVVLEK